MPLLSTLLPRIKVFTTVMQFKLIALLIFLVVSANGAILKHGGEFWCMLPLLVHTILILYWSLLLSRKNVLPGRDKPRKD